MSDDFLVPGTVTQITREESAYDILENALIKMKTTAEVYEHVSRWIASKLNPEYIVMLEEHKKVDVPNYLSVCRVGTGVNISDMIAERNAKCPDEFHLFVHSSGAISLPYAPSVEKKGYLLIGKPLKNGLYTNQQIREFLPVVRILEKALLICAAHHSDSERTRLQDAFSRYVSPDVVQGIVNNNPDMMRIGGEKKNLSCLFTDIEGFTTLSDSMEPEIVVRLLNIYLNEMSQVIISLGGVIDKFEGDAIVAFFGAPHEFTDHAIRCCLAAMRMKRMERVLNEQLQMEKLIDKPLVTRIGINTGDMVVGNIGSLQRIDYTVIGSNVNIASRLESANKVLKTGVLISDATYSAVKDYFDCKQIGLVKLRGVSHPIRTYELLGQKENVKLDYDNFSVPYMATADNAVEEAEELEEV